MKQLFALSAIITLAGIGCQATPLAAPEPVTSLQNATSTTEAATTVIASNLEVPWDIAFLPNDEMIVSERTGELSRFGHDGKKHSITGTPDTKTFGEGGLLGIALHPDFAKNTFIYVYYSSGGLLGTSCHVERYTLENDTLSNKTTILTDIPGAVFHDGGRMAFGPDGKLYITTGDATNSDNAQKTDSLSGKILRVNDDGSIPSDNPFANAVWSYGHRNPQGLAWDDQGRLWSTEHGRSGISSGYDELNLIEKGKNYGWPTIEGPKTKEGFETARLQSGAATTWAPASLVYYKGKMLFGGLLGQSLYVADISQNPPTITSELVKTYGRIRTVVIGPDGFIYLTTSNTDGRGTKKADDDKIIRLDPKTLGL